MNATLKPAVHGGDYKVADLALADFGRKEIAMPRPRCRVSWQYARNSRALSPEGRAHLRLPAHDHPDRGAHRNAAGARASVRWASGNSSPPRITPPPPWPRRGIAGVRLERRVARGLLEYTHRIFEWPDGGYSNMILDDGGDATLLLHLGTRAESDPGVIAKPAATRSARCSPPSAPGSRAIRAGIHAHPPDPGRPLRKPLPG